LKIGINAWAFPPNMTIPQGLRLAKGAGFDAVELNLSEDGYLQPGMSERDVAGLRAAADNMSLEYPSLSSGLTWSYPLTSPDPEVAEKGKEIVREGLRVAKVLGADTLLVIPGLVLPDVPYDVAYDRARAALRELALDAKRRKVVIGVENVWSKFLLSPLEMRDFIDSIGSDYVQVYFDIGNVLVSGFPEQWIRILGSRIKKVHVKDFRLDIGNRSGFANPMQGDVDWVAVRSGLREIGYDDTLTAEIPGYKSLPDLGIHHAAESLRRVFRQPNRQRQDEAGGRGSC